MLFEGKIMGELLPEETSREELGLLMTGIIAGKGDGPIMQLKLEKRATPSTSMSLLVSLVSIILALLVCAVFLLVSGFNPLEIYGMMAKSAFGTPYGLMESLVKAIPLMLCGLGVSLAFRMQLWNIGARGPALHGGDGRDLGRPDFSRPAGLF